MVVAPRRRPGADRSRQDVARRVPAGRTSRAACISILQEFAARAHQPDQAREPPDQGGGLGDYCFIIDAEGHIADELVADCLRDLHAKQGEVKFLGSYPAAGDARRGRARGRRLAWREADDWIASLRSKIG